jgi:hypothetical protein
MPRLQQARSIQKVIKQQDSETRDLVERNMSKEHFKQMQMKIENKLLRTIKEKDPGLIE